MSVSLFVYYCLWIQVYTCENKLVYLLLCMYLGVFVCVLGSAEGQAHNLWNFPRIGATLAPNIPPTGFFHLWKWVQCVGSRSALVMLPESRHDNSGHPSRA